MTLYIVHFAFDALNGYKNYSVFEQAQALCDRLRGLIKKHDLKDKFDIQLRVEKKQFHEHEKTEWANYTDSLRKQLDAESVERIVQRLLEELDNRGFDDEDDDHKETSAGDFDQIGLN